MDRIGKVGKMKIETVGKIGIEEIKRKRYKYGNRLLCGRNIETCRNIEIGRNIEIEICRNIEIGRNGIGSYMDRIEGNI